MKELAPIKIFLYGLIQAKYMLAIDDMREIFAKDGKNRCELAEPD